MYEKAVPPERDTAVFKCMPQTAKRYYWTFTPSTVTANLVVGSLVLLLSSFQSPLWTAAKPVAVEFVISSVPSMPCSVCIWIAALSVEASDVNTQSFTSKLYMQGPSEYTTIALPAVLNVQLLTVTPELLFP